MNREPGTGNQEPGTLNRDPDPAFALSASAFAKGYGGQVGSAGPNREQRPENLTFPVSAHLSHSCVP
jgi:hypothetical protein